MSLFPPFYILQHNPTIVPNLIPKTKRSHCSGCLPEQRNTFTHTKPPPKTLHYVLISPKSFSLPLCYLHMHTHRSLLPFPHLILSHSYTHTKHTQTSILFMTSKINITEMSDSILYHYFSSSFPNSHSTS